MDTQNLKFFQHIVNFVEDLSDNFGTKQHSLMLYKRLIGKTKITHHDAIRRHNSAFSTFLIKNKESIIEKKTSFKEPVIFYSNKVNIKMDEIFKLADSETSDVIWKHLLVLLNTYDPSSKALDVLKRSLNENSKEGEFITNLVNKIETNVDPSNSDPMSAIMGLMSSGVFNDIVSTMNSGMKDGSLDMGKLFGTVQSMMGSLGGGMEGMAGPGGMNIQSLMSNFGSMLNAQGGESGESEEGSSGTTVNEQSPSE